MSCNERIFYMFIVYFFFCFLERKRKKNQNNDDSLILFMPLGNSGAQKHTIRKQCSSATLLASQKSRPEIYNKRVSIYHLQIKLIFYSITFLLRYDDHDESEKIRKKNLPLKATFSKQFLQNSKPSQLIMSGQTPLVFDKLRRRTHISSCRLSNAQANAYTASTTNWVFDSCSQL